LESTENIIGLTVNELRVELCIKRFLRFTYSARRGPDTEEVKNQNKNKENEMNRKRVFTTLITMMIGAFCMAYGTLPQGNVRKYKAGRYPKGKKARMYETQSANPRTGSTTDKPAQKQGPTVDDKTSHVSTSTKDRVVQPQTPKVEDKPSFTAELKQKAESGDVTAQLNLALCYDSGSGIEKNPVEAHKWFLKAAEQGNGRAMNAVGTDYANGIGGVEKDLTEAVKWYRKSVEQGNDRGQNSLGWCYECGKGVEKDLTEAVKWYRKSTEQGNAFAQCNLGRCYEYGKGVEKDLTEAVKWYRKSAEQGNAFAQCNLGTRYKNGEDRKSVV
jgi:hypothetical protein